MPLYLYVERGYSLNETLLFFIFYSVVFAVMTPAAAKFAARYGVKHSVLLSVPFYLSFIGLLYALPFVNISLLLISSFLGASQAFYWMGTHMLFHHASDRQHRGEEIGLRGSINVLAGMLGPLLGGAMIMYLGFSAVFALVAVLLLFSAVVLFSSKENHIRYHFSVKSLLRSNSWRDCLFFVSRGTEVIANGVIWPLFIFVILKDYFSLGIAGSILSGVSALLLLLVGRYSDRTDKRRIILWATVSETLVWFFRAMVQTTVQVFGVSILAALVTGIRESPLGALEYDKAQGEIAAYFVSREVFICLGRILMLTLVLMADSLSSGLVFQGAANMAAWLF